LVRVPTVSTFNHAATAEQLFTVFFEFTSPVPPCIAPPGKVHCVAAAAVHGLPSLTHKFRRRLHCPLGRCRFRSGTIRHRLLIPPPVSFLLPLDVTHLPFPLVVSTSATSIVTVTTAFNRTTNRCTDDLDFTEGFGSGWTLPCLRPTATVISATIVLSSVYAVCCYRTAVSERETSETVNDRVSVTILLLFFTLVIMLLMIL
jgi:hypothetical protein